MYLSGENYTALPLLTIYMVVENSCVGTLTNSVNCMALVLFSFKLSKREVSSLRTVVVLTLRMIFHWCCVVVIYLTVLLWYLQGCIKASVAAVAKQ